MVKKKKKNINKDIEHLNNIFNTTDLRDFAPVLETDPEMGLDVAEVSRGYCL